MWSVLEKEKVPFPFQGCIYLSDRMVYSQPIWITSYWATAVIGGVLIFEKQDVSFLLHHCIEFWRFFLFLNPVSYSGSESQSILREMSNMTTAAWSSCLHISSITAGFRLQWGVCVWGILDRGSMLPPTGLKQQNIFEVLGCVRHFSCIKCQLFTER